MTGIPSGIIDLWRECFGDDENYVREFFDSFDNRGNVFTAVNDHGEIKLTDGFSDGETVGLCSRVPVKLCRAGIKTDGYYIYGGAVSEKYRGRHIYSALMDKAEENAAFTVLIPEVGNEYLYSLYGKRGYRLTEYSPFPFVCDRSALSPLRLAHFRGDYSGLCQIAAEGSHDRLIPDERFTRFIFEGFDERSLYFIHDDKNVRRGYVICEQMSGGSVKLCNLYAPDYECEAMNELYALCRENSRRKAMFRSDTIDAFPSVACMGE